MRDKSNTVSDSFFVVDPIDGTRAYLRGEDTWCVSIALVAGGRPVAGVIVAPSLDETFTATADGATLMNGVPCRSSQPDAGAQLKLSMPDSMRKMLQNDGAEPFIAMKSIPSLAYRVALVADGRLDGTLVRPNANDWDIAAADLLLERAGGRLTDGQGRRLLYTSAARTAWAVAGRLEWRGVEGRTARCRGCRSAVTASGRCGPCDPIDRRSGRGCKSLAGSAQTKA